MVWYQKMQQLVSKAAMVLVGAVFVAALLSMTGFWLVEQELVARAGESLAVTAKGVADKVDAMLLERKGDLEILAGASQMHSTDVAQVTRYLHSIQRAYPVYSRLMVTNRAGRVVASTDENWIGQDVREASWFQAARHSPLMHAETVREQASSAGQLAAVVFARSISDPNGAFLGAIMTEVGRTTWNQLAEESVSQFSAQTESFGTVRYRVVSHDGSLLLTYQDDDRVSFNLRQMGLPSAVKVATGQLGYTEEEHLIRKIPIITGYARMNGIPSLTALHWGVLVQADRAEVLASIHGRLLKVGLLGLVGFMLMLAALLWTSYRQQLELRRTKEAERAQHNSELRAKKVIEHALDAVVMIDENSRIIEWNQQAEQIFGWSHEEVLGRELSETIVPPALREAYKQGVLKFLATDESPILGRRIEMIAARRSGKEFPVELMVTPIRLEGGTMFSLFMLDISDRKKMIDRLREGETFFRLLSEQLPVGVFEINEDGSCLYKNKMWDTIMGYLNDEVFGFASAALPAGTWVDWVHPDDRPALAQNWEAAQASFGRLHAECRLAGTEGRDRWVEIQLWPMADDRGFRYLGTIEDVTNRREMMDRLRTSETFFRLLSDYLPIGVFEINNRGACLYGNRMWRTLLNCLDEANGCHSGPSGSWLQWFHPDDRDKVEEEWEGSRATFDRIAVECRLADGAEEVRWVSVLLWPMTTNEGVRYLGTLEDITERKRTVAHTMTLLRHGRFELQTPIEARNLAELLAYAFPDPFRTQLGLTELLINGVEHGNLEISYAEKSSLLENGRLDVEIARRLALPENRRKRVWVSVDRTAKELEMTIVDDGKGFDWHRYLALDGDRGDDTHGRGIAMSRSISFDRLEYQAPGNQVVVSTRLTTADQMADRVNEQKAA